jgi:hypothetical protein
MSVIKSLLLLTLLFFGGCYSANEAPIDRAKPVTSTESAQQAGSNKLPGETQFEKVSLNQVDQSQSMAEALNRKIIRNAELYLEIRDPAEGQRKITSIAESLGGFVVTSESKQSDTQDPTKKELEVNLVVRIPALQYNSALEQIRAVSNRVIQEKTSGQDVTEDFIDLEARIKTQKALEVQFLEIMKQANKVGDALEIQRQIAEVRTEIEKLEGRKRFLENRASLSTITVNLRTPAVIAVNTTGFGRNVKIAFSDSFAIATEIVLFLIRFVMVMVPVVLLIILPGALLARYLFRLAQRWRPATQSRSSESD